MDIVKFWDNNFKTEKYDDTVKINDFCPNINFFNRLMDYKNLSVLDYGAGNGWASYLLAANNKVLSADVSKNALDIINHYKKLFNLNNISTKLIDDDFFKSNLKYDLIFTSNVLDVIPLSMTRNLLKNFYNSLNENSLLIVSLNYYLDLNEACKAYTVKDKEVYIDNVLRLVSLTDKEWINEFSLYFDLVSLDYFSWPGEEKNTRRYFVLKKKNL